MIDISVYRIRIGNFNLLGRGRVKSGRDKTLKRNKFSPDLFAPTQFLSLNISEGTCSAIRVDGAKRVWCPVLSFICYFYSIFLLLILSLHLSSVGPPTAAVPLVLNLASLTVNISGLPFLCITLVKTAYFCLFSSILTRCPNKILFHFKKSRKRLNKLLNFLVLALLLLNFLMIGICNPSLLNPGPNCLSVSYQNVQGLIPFSQLSKNHPQLDHTKTFELNAHLNVRNPDILILNETWLKKSIKDHEIIQNPNYDVWRNDRSQVTHPADPNNPKKFRKNGGGVLIAVRSNIDASFKRLSVRKGAEMLAVEITIGNNKYVFCTVYRVGTLGKQNHESVIQSIKSFYQGRCLKKVFMIGDFNLSSIVWPLNDNSSSSTDRIERLFVESFNELGLYQCVTDPTHIKGKTLDLLLTNQKPIVTDIEVEKHAQICKSDHYPISFKVNVKTKNKIPPKRKIYNFKRANWDQLNRDLREVPWSALIDCTDPESAWKNFKTVLFALIDKHIPKISIKNDFTAPWFDSECFSAYRAKERAHKKFKINSSLLNELKRDATRRDFKKVCNTKMRDNLYNSDDPALITKKVLVTRQVKC